MSYCIEKVRKKMGKLGRDQNRAGAHRSTILVNNAGKTNSLPLLVRYSTQLKEEI